jgi:hypothetical protein
VFTLLNAYLVAFVSTVAASSDLEHGGLHGMAGIGHGNTRIEVQYCVEGTVMRARGVLSSRIILLLLLVLDRGSIVVCSIAAHERHVVVSGVWWHIG